MQSLIVQLQNDQSYFILQFIIILNSIQKKLILIINTYKKVIPSFFKKNFILSILKANNNIYFYLLDLYNPNLVIKKHPLTILINKIIYSTEILDQQAMSLHKFQHTPIPFDQLELFQSPQKNQMFLIQTLLFSTKITLHYQKYKYSTYFILTKHNIWFKDQKKKQNIFALPIKSLLGVIKSQQHPQILFVTDNRYDNVRISVSNQQRYNIYLKYVHRCNHIISALSYIYTRIIKQNDQLKVIFVKPSNLKQYQKTFQAKIKQNFNFLAFFNSHKHLIVTYRQPRKDQIYGQLNLQKKKMCLIKQIFNNKKHMIHVAKLVEAGNGLTQNSVIKLESTQNEKQSLKQKEESYYYLHTIQKSEQIIQQLRNYQPFPYDNLSQQLVFVRQLDYKIQLFFKYLPQVPKQGSPYYSYKLTPQRLFINLIEFYDIILQEAPEMVLDFQLICFQNVENAKQTKQKNNKNLLGPRTSFKIAQQINNDFSQIILNLRQFRYDFLLTSDNQLKKLIYQCYYQKGEVIYDPHSWKTKFYHLSLILYEFMYGKQYFSTQLDPQIILKLKQSKKVVFPKYLNTQSNFLMTYQLQDFIQKCLKVRFKTLDEVYNHPWMKQKVLVLAHQHKIRKRKKQDDKKTDATKSF